MLDSSPEELALGDYVALFRRRWRWVATTMLVVVGVVAAVTLASEKTYASSAAVLVLTDANEALFNQSNEDLHRKPLAELAYLESDQYLAAVEEVAGFPVEVHAEVRQQSTLQKIEDASVLRLTVEAPTPEQARDGAAAASAVYLTERTAQFRRSFENQAERVAERRSVSVERRSALNAELEEARRLREAAVDPVTQLTLDSEYQLLLAERQPAINSLSTQIGVLDLELARLAEMIQALEQPEAISRIQRVAALPQNPVSPDVPFNILVAIAASLVLGALLAVARDLLDNRAFDGAVLARLVETPVMATIGEIRSERSAPGRVRRYRDLSPKELRGYQVLLNSLWLSNVSNPLQSVVFSSDRPGVGKTQTVVNLAQAEAARGTRVLVVDTDFANPSVVDRLELEHTGVGLTDLLSGRAAIENVVIQTDLPTLHVLDCEQSESASDLLRSDRFGRMLDDLTESYDLILIDAMPTLGTSDSRLVALQADAVVVVYDPAGSRREELQHTIDLLRNSGANLVGLVANRSRSSHPIYLARQSGREKEPAFS